MLLCEGITGKKIGSGVVLKQLVYNMWLMKNKIVLLISLFVFLCLVTYFGIELFSFSASVPPVTTPAPTQKVVQKTTEPTPIADFIMYDKNGNVTKEMTMNEGLKYLETTYTSPTPTPTLDPNEKHYCYVEKNGTFWMTMSECSALHDANPEEFLNKAVYNCIDGKNIEIGDLGSREDRKPKCEAFFNVELTN